MLFTPLLYKGINKGDKSIWEEITSIPAETRTVSFPTLVRMERAEQTDFYSASPPKHQTPATPLVFTPVEAVPVSSRNET